VITGNESLIILGNGSIGAPIEDLSHIRKNLYNIIEIENDSIHVYTRETHPDNPYAFSYYNEYIFVNRPLIEDS